jgi:hypothetical protein
LDDFGHDRPDDDRLDAPRSTTDRKTTIDWQDRLMSTTGSDGSVPLDNSDDRRAEPRDRDRLDADARTGRLDDQRDVITTNRHDVVEREKNEFGGMKFGSAFFGWLTATGMAVILTAILAAIGAGVGLGTNTDLNKATKGVASNATTVGIVSAIVLAVILFVAYYCGGYVAGRMARFNGAKQGFAVWIWAVVIAIIAAIITAIAGAKANVLGNINAFPRIPIDEGTLTITSIITVIVVALIALLGAIVGGLAGMRYHRKVDRVGLGR